MSPIPAITKPHLNDGAQKNTVVGPEKTVGNNFFFMFFDKFKDDLFFKKI